MSQMTAPQPESLDAAVGRRVHMLMWDRRVTQTALGRTIGMDQSSMSKRLRGDRGWSLDDLRAVATALDTTIGYLVGETPAPTIPTDNGTTVTHRKHRFAIVGEDAA